jgi:prepilin-type N-terminal cleavage/methylation domain-containing protein
MEKNKGFTLVELLAVIVILAIIMLIAIPAVLQTMQSAERKGFEEFTIKSINETEKKILSNSLLDKSRGSQCEIFNIKTDLGLSNTGDFDGYILAKNTNGRYEYIITLWNDDYMIKPYNFTTKTSFNGIQKEIVDSLEAVNEEEKSLFSVSNLCGLGCNTCDVNDEIIEATCMLKVNDSIDFNYTGSEQIFPVHCSGTYLLEVWGAAGGLNMGNNSIKGKGGYATGRINLEPGTNLYINVGGVGGESNRNNQPLVRGKGGYNGGGDGGAGFIKSDGTYNASGAGGGGATHIATVSGLLKSLEKYKDTAGLNISNEIIIVAGGGGGYAVGVQAGAGGGFKGTDVPLANIDGYDMGGKSKGGTQSGGYKFGQGQSADDRNAAATWGSEGKGGAGGGWYGGTTSNVEGDFSNDAGSGGSGYIANPYLYSKSMYCLDCEESNEYNYFTVNTLGASDLRDTRKCSKGYETAPISKCSKSGNGYARITYLG